MSRAVVLLSGGLDSAVNLALAAASPGVALAVTADYGQRSSEQEISAAAAMSERLRVPHRVIPLPWLAPLSSSAVLRGRGNPPKPTVQELDDVSGAAARTADAVWVPNRNGVLLNAAAALAEQSGADQVVVGFNAEEAATFPDNSVAFVDAVNRSLRFSTRGAVQVRCDTAGMTKAQIVDLGRSVGAPLDLVWPCYLGGERMCGQCESCMRFLRAVARADAKAWFRGHHPLMPTGT